MSDENSSTLALYASFIYSLLYMSLEWVPIVFQDIRGWHPIIGSLPFLALFIGILFAMGLNLGFQPYYHRAVEAAVLKREVLPENVANAVFVLCSSDLSHTTGLHIPVDAGVAAAFLR